MIPLTKEWFKAKEKEKLLEKKEQLEHKIKCMIEVAKLERKDKKYNVFKALVRRLVSLDIELDQVKGQLKKHQ